jgi:hypothetical protein
MATGDIPLPAGGGLKSIADLYDLINGTTKTDSGSTKTTTEGISQDSMNAMLQSALSSTNGLAAISQGQRTAGGYGSATNQMLTNDLLTRTAGQIAAANKTATTTVSPTTQTTGGVTLGGAAKSVGFLAALQQLSDTGTSGKKFYELLTGGKSGTDTPVVPMDATANDAVGAGVAANPMALDPMQRASQETPSGVGGSAIDFSSFMGSETPVFESTPVVDSGTSSDILPEDAFFAADGGMVTASGMKGPFQNLGSAMNPIKLADGGMVSKKSLGILGTSQFNSVIDPRESLAGTVGAGGNAANPDGTPVGQVLDPTTNVSTPVAGSGGSSGVSDGNGGVTQSQGGLTGALGNIISGDATNKDYGTLAQGVGLLGSLTGNSGLAKAGQVGSIAASDSLTSAGLTAANIVTKGAIGEVSNIVKTIKDPTLGNIVDTTAGFTPIGRVANSILSLAGLGSLGDIAENARFAANPTMTINNPMSAAQQDAVTSAAADNAKAVAAQEAQAAAEADAANMVNSVNGFTASGRGTGLSGITPAITGGYTGQDTGPSATPTGSSPGSMSVSAADGGAISGPGSSISDSIHAHLSDGEYVLSADTVKAIGVENLDALQAKYHTPAATQKLMAYGKAR